jgi:hypothetical protein
VRRLAATLAAVVLLAPAGVRLAAAGVDIEALRCAIACGHAATPGAVCCPMAGRPAAEAALAACPQGDPQSLAPILPAQPLLVGSIVRLAAPRGDSLLERIPGAAPRTPFTRPPDHVPLLLS